MRKVNTNEELAGRLAGASVGMFSPIGRALAFLLVSALLLWGASHQVHALQIHVITRWRRAKLRDKK
jgi:hypothetical protein